jgi:hypothetical protein
MTGVRASVPRLPCPTATRSAATHIDAIMSSSLGIVTVVTVFPAFGATTHWVDPAIYLHPSPRHRRCMNNWVEHQYYK